MRQYLVQHWGWRQVWHDVVVWEMEPYLLGDFLNHINPCGGATDGTRVLRTQQPAAYRYLGGGAWLYLKDDLWQIELEREEWRRANPS